MTDDLTIGRVAKLAGVHVETIRYYQRRGLLIEPDKPWGAYRRYPADAVKHLRFIKRAQALGFTLEEIGDLLHLSEASACAETRNLATHKVELIDRKMADLAAMRKSLATLIRRCDPSHLDEPCPIIVTLAQD